MARPAVPRHTLEVRTECVSSARSGLCGGRRVISVSTAIKTFISGANAVLLAEGNTCGHDSASVHMARRGRRPWHVQTLLVSGNRESSRSTARSKAAGPRQEGEEP